MSEGTMGPVKADAAFPGAAAVIAAAAAWGMSGVFVARITAASPVSAVALAFWRDLFACITLMLFTLSTHPKNLRIRKKDLPWILAMGFGLGAFHIFYNRSIVLNGAAVTTVQQAAMPAVVAVAALYLWQERLTRAKLLSMVFIFTGTVMASGLNFFDLENAPLAGLATGFTVPVFYSVWTICGKRVVPVYGATASLAVAFGIAALLLLPLQPFTAQPFPLNTTVVLSFSGLIAVSTFGAFSLYMIGLKYIQASIAAILVMSEILFAGVYAWFLLGERLGPVQILGALLVMAGVAWLSWKQDR